MAIVKKIKSKKQSKWNIAFIPGGPGLSSISFGPLAQYVSEFSNCLLIDPAGTGDAKNEVLGTTDVNPSFQDLIDDLTKALEGVENLILCGHSFGGIQSAILATQEKLKIEKIIFLGAPFTPNTLKVAGEAYNLHKTPLLAKLEDKFFDAPSDESIRNWFAEYNQLYFYILNIEAGKKMLSKDVLSFRNHLGARSHIPDMAKVLNEIKEHNIPALAVSGADDLLIPPGLAFADALMANAQTCEVPMAGHFMHFEQPKKLAEIIRSFLNS